MNKLQPIPENIEVPTWDITKKKLWSEKMTLEMPMFNQFNADLSAKLDALETAGAKSQNAILAEIEQSRQVYIEATMQTSKDYLNKLTQAKILFESKSRGYNVGEIANALKALAKPKKQKKQVRKNDSRRKSTVNKRRVSKTS